MQPNMPLTAEAVRAATFDKAPFGRRGYHEDQVDAFLDRVEAALEGGEPITAAEVSSVEFDAAPIVRRGYHEGQVDEFLDLVVEHLERVEAGEDDLDDDDFDDPPAPRRQPGQATGPRVVLPPTPPGKTALELPPGMSADPTPPPRRRVIPNTPEPTRQAAPPPAAKAPAAQVPAAADDDFEPFVLSDDLPAERPPAPAQQQPAQPRQAQHRPAASGSTGHTSGPHQLPVKDQRRVFLPPPGNGTTDNGDGAQHPRQAPARPAQQPQATQQPQQAPVRRRHEAEEPPRRDNREWFTEPRGYPPVPPEHQAQHQQPAPPPVQQQPAQQQPPRPQSYPTRHAAPELPIDSDVPFLPLPPAPAGVRGYRTGDVERLVQILTRAATSLDDIPTAEELEAARPGLTFFVGQGYHQAAVDAVIEAWVDELHRREH
ncbi:DivIVA domain-containing protein [Actinokineospora spheciospongiae]|nr:DivIVA domain-containing protein [Actinokineospora spheciospongiae]